MQLILNTDSDIGIPRNMSVIEQESLSLDEKFTNNDVKDKVENDISDLMEVIIDKNSEDCHDNDDSTVNNVKSVSENSEAEEKKNDDEIQKESSRNNVSNQQDSYNSNQPNNEKENLNFTENNISDSVKNKETENEFSEKLQDDKTIVEDVNDKDEERERENEEQFKNKDIDEVMIESTELNIEDISQRNKVSVEECIEESMEENIEESMEERVEASAKESMEESIEGGKTSICEEDKTENEEMNQQNNDSVVNITSGEGIDMEINECNSENKQDINEDCAMEVECEIEKNIETPISCEEKQAIVKSEFIMRIKNVSEINEENRLRLESEKGNTELISIDLLDKGKNDEITVVKTVYLKNKIQFESKEIVSEDLENTAPNLNKESEKSVENEVGTDIAYEKEDECCVMDVETVIDQDMSDLAKEPDKKIDSEDNFESCEQNRLKNDIECNGQENVINAESKKSEHLNETNETEINENIKIPLDHVKNSQSIKQVNTPVSSVKEKKPLLHISKLSNTLDILSDDEEEQPEGESQVQPTVDKQCINLDEDDDIMLIDEETSQDSSNITVPSETEKKKDEEIKELGDSTEAIIMDVADNNPDVDPEVKDDKVSETEPSDDKQEKETEGNSSIENTSLSKPLLPVNFLKSCKKNLTEMSREELEEFCILKIVESIADRSNLSEINLQLKSMAASVDEYKKKTNTLMKQNRDLQVVLKSVQEEMKIDSGYPITPLKITRSVGMQVILDEMCPLRKFPVTPNRIQNSLALNSVKSSKGLITTKGQNPNNQQYPVPRLVPAVNNSITNIKSSISIQKTQNNIQNGVKKSPPIAKPEKRSFSKMQQGSSITVDLTDDEPPSKVVQRNITAPVRLIPQQTMLSPQRPPFANAINTPRKVYIPISGSQNQNGQAIVLKQLNPHVPRLRGPAILPKPGNSVRMPKTAMKHPAPLPDPMKQYQPPIWKALPPAPNLKLSKVENGIVISWNIEDLEEENHEEIASYQLYAYQETAAPPSTALWKKIGDVKALALPMACTLTQFMSGYKYYFAVRAVDIRSRLGPFSSPGCIVLNKTKD